jgi:mannosylglycoprotein endo-beta-mannosidase
MLGLVSGAQTAININRKVGNFFHNGRGVRQGDPLSPLLFDYAVDALAAILDKAKEAGHIQGVVPHLIQGGISHLQYANDTIIMIQPEDIQIANLKFILLCFENMSGIQINFHKSAVMVLGTSPLEQQHITNMLNSEGTFPFTYLGLPISDRALTTLIGIR